MEHVVVIGYISAPSGCGSSLKDIGHSRSSCMEEEEEETLLLLLLLLLLKDTGGRAAWDHPT